jgi:Bax protein
MKKVFFSLLLSFCFANATSVSPKYSVLHVPKNMSVAQKKKRFYALMVPVVQKVYDELMQEYLDTKKTLDTKSDPKKIAQLKKRYKKITDEGLLGAMKPHPPSLTLAQAAMESSWGTSKFFTEANNAFGVWSFNPNEPRIAATQKRAGKMIWLKKYTSLEESVRSYYMVLAKNVAHKHFRKARLESDNVLYLVKKLDRYSEMKERYGVELARMIKYNKLRRFDPKHF